MDKRANPKSGMGQDGLMNQKRKPIDYLTHDEMMLMRVIETAMKAAQTREELQEAKN